MGKLVVTETDNGVTTVTLNRPEQLNALSTALKAEIADTFVALTTDDATKVIILTGAGRAFCAGLDLKELGQKGLRQGTGVDLQEAITGVGKPLIGAINGFAITGGFEIALMCDILIGSPNTRFADTHVRMGVVPGWGLSQRLSTLVGVSRAKQMSFTGNYIDADTAEKWGLINAIVPADELLSYCKQLAADICNVDQQTLKTVHQLIDFGVQHSLAEGLIEEKRRSLGHSGDMSPDTLEQRRKAVTDRGREQKG